MKNAQIERKEDQHYRSEGNIKPFIIRKRK